MINETNAAEPSGASAGSHGEPVAWAVCTPENWGQETPCFFCEQQARDHASTITGMKNIVKLYRQFTLTDEERHAIAVVRNCAMTRAERFLTQSDAEREATLVLWRLRERLA